MGDPSADLLTEHGLRGEEPLRYLPLSLPYHSRSSSLLPSSKVSIAGSWSTNGSVSQRIANSRKGSVVEVEVYRPPSKFGASC